MSPQDARREQARQVGWREREARASQRQRPIRHSPMATAPEVPRPVNHPRRRRTPRRLSAPASVPRARHASKVSRKQPRECRSAHPRRGSSRPHCASDQVGNMTTSPRRHSAGAGGSVADRRRAINTKAACTDSSMAGICSAAATIARTISSEVSRVSRRSSHSRVRLSWRMAIAANAGASTKASECPHAQHKSPNTSSEERIPRHCRLRSNQ